MTYFIIFGVRSSKLEEKRLRSNTNCPNCQRKSSFVVKGEANYFHLFWIPVIPLPKVLRVQCVHCDKEFEKKDFPEDVKRAVKQENVKRPIWHIIIPIFLLFKIVSALFVFGYFFVEDAMQDYEHEKIKAAEAVKEEERKQVFANDKKSMQFTPSLTTDSISYKIKQEFPFTEHDINADQVALFSKIEDKKLLLLIDVKEDGKFIEAEGCVLVSQIKNFLIHAYPKKRYDYFIALYENDDLKLLHTPAEVYKTEYESPTPLYSFYANDWFYYKNADVFKNKQEKLKLLSEYGKKDINPEKVDFAKEEEAWNSMFDKFKFSYREQPASVEKRVLYECKFTLETGSVLPDEIRRMFQMYDGNGPFVSWNFLYSKTKKVYANYKYATIKALTKRSEIDERLLPVYASPYWIPFYDDDTFSYAIDMLPGEKGQVGQIILIKPRKKPIYIAKNMTEFLKLYRDEKVPMNIGSWTR